MVIKLNGASSEVAAGSTVQDVVESRQLPLNFVVVELNGEILRREKWGATVLQAADCLEIVRLIGGG